jgi:phosphate transport system substrate-binding protein
MAAGRNSSILRGAAPRRLRSRTDDDRAEKSFWRMGTPRVAGVATLCSKIASRPGAYYTRPGSGCQHRGGHALKKRSCAPKADRVPYRDRAERPTEPSNALGSGGAHVIHKTKEPVVFKRIVLRLLIIALGVCACTSSRTRSIQIKGSDTMVNLVQSWAEKYMEENPGEFVAVTGGGSGTGFASLISRTCDIAMSSRNIKQKEIVLANKQGVNPFEIKVALDGLAVVVHPSNPVDKLTMDQLAAIFSGKITSWKEIGGTDEKIVVLSREVNSGTHVYFKEHVLRRGDRTSTAEFAPSALMLSSSQAIADEVMNNPAAIGYYGMGYITKSQKPVAVAKDAQSEYVEPTIENVINGSYPISRPLLLYTNGPPDGLIKKFVDFALSKEGQHIVLTTDFVPVER